MRSILLLVLGTLTVGSSMALADALDTAVMQKVDRDHKIEVQRGTFAKQKALAKANIASKGGGRAIASEGSARSSGSHDENVARILDHETSGPSKPAITVNSTAKTVAKAPAAIVKTVAVNAPVKPKGDRR